MKKRRTVNYVNNKDLYNAMVIYKECYKRTHNSGERPEIPKVTNEYIGQCILAIAKRLAHKPNFAGYSYRDEMISDGYENCIMYMHNFDPDKYNNPFAYFTQIIKFSFVRRIQKEKKQQYVKLKNMEDHFTFNEHAVDKGDRFDRNLYENNHEYIKQYEIALTKKKKPGKKVGVEKFVEEDLKVEDD